MTWSALIVLAYATACAVCDARTRHIPNRLTLLGLALAALYRVASGALWLPALAGVAVFYWSWRNQDIGGGDAKTLMALWLAWPAPALALMICATFPVYYAFHRLFFHRSRFPALVPTALGVWIYAFSTGLWLVPLLR
jgi:Flp pilus assembly protein protease CpaA